MPRPRDAPSCRRHRQRFTSVLSGTSCCHTVILFAINRPLTFYSYAKPICHDGFFKLSRLSSVANLAGRVTEFPTAKNFEFPAQRQFNTNITPRNTQDTPQWYTCAPSSSRPKEAQEEPRRVAKQCVLTCMCGFQSQRRQGPVCFFSTSNIYESNNFCHRTGCFMTLQ